MAASDKEFYNFSSIWGISAVAGAAAYHATKGAVRNLTKNAAVTYATDGIRVNSIQCLGTGSGGASMSEQVADGR